MNWISCSEHMPDRHTRVLAYSFGQVRLACFDGGLWWFTLTEYRFKDEVTHWMPLPESPK